MPTVLTADKIVDILERIAASPTGVGTRELARQLDLNVATVHNIAKTLEAKGYLQQSANTKHFHLGLRLMMLGRHQQYLETLTDLGRPVVDQLAADINESVMFGALDQTRVINLHYRPSKQALRTHEPEDISNIAYCTAIGKLMLAHMSPQQLDAYLALTPLKSFTPRTITTRGALDKTLAQIRKDDFASARDELCDGVTAMAVPVKDPWGKTIAAVAASAPTQRISAAAQWDYMRDAVTKAAQQITESCTALTR